MAAAVGQGVPRVHVDRELCVASQMCMSLAPATFEPGESGQAHVRDPQGDALEDLLDAKFNCPVAAITVEPDHAD